MQVKKCADSGANMVRITVQGKQEATACYKIREQLFKDGCAYCLAHSLVQKDLYTVETRFYCPQTFLSLHFQCRDDISDLKQMFWD